MTGTTYLKDQKKAIEKLESAGFNEDQVDAIMNYADFQEKYSTEYVSKLIINAKREMNQIIIEHGHLQGKTVVPL